MAQTVDWQTRQAAIDADPAVVKASKAHELARDAAQAFQHKPLAAARKIATLQLGSDLMMRKGWQFESTPKELDEQLENLTGDDAECWWTRYSQLETLLDELVIETCRTVVALSDELAQLTAAREAAWDVLRDARTAAAERFDAAHKGAIVTHETQP